MKRPAICKPRSAGICDGLFIEKEEILVEFSGSIAVKDPKEEEIRAKVRKQTENWIS